MKAIKMIGSTASWVLALVICFALMPTAATAAVKVVLPVNVYGEAADGAIDTENYIEILPNGTIQTFTIPTGKTLVIKSIIVSFEPTNPFTTPVEFVIETSGTSSTRFLGHNLDTNGDNTFGHLGGVIEPGLALSVKPVMKVIDSSGTTVDGILKVRVFGKVQ